MGYYEQNKKNGEFKPYTKAGIDRDAEFILDIKRLGINGEGIGYYNKLAVFVPGAIPGEGHNVKVTKADGKMAFAASLECKHSSPYRVNPECPYYKECGCCPVMHIAYDKMLDFKRDMVIEALKRYTTINPKQFEIKPTVGLENPYYYKNRAVYTIKKGDHGIEAAFIRSKSFDSFTMDGCMVENKLIKTIKKEVVRQIGILGVPAYLFKFGRGVIRFLSIRVTREGKAMVIFICHDKSPKLKELAEKVLEIPGVVSVYESFNLSDKPLPVLGEETNLLAGEAYITEKIGKQKYHVYPQSFMYPNSFAAEAMLDTMVKNAKLSFKERVLDINCGAGILSLAFSHNAKEVIGVDYNKESITLATENAEFNRMKNVKFLQGEASNLLPKLIQDGTTIDVIIASPSKSGILEATLQEILNSGVKKLILLSSNPASFAKNAEVLKSKYMLTSITPFDVMPQTAEVSLVAVFKGFEEKIEE